MGNCAACRYSARNGFMKCICLHDKREIENYLRKDVYRNIYSIGDLDDFFWPYTTWYGFNFSGEISAIALMYTGLLLPTLVAFSREGEADMLKLLNSMRSILPNRFYAHLSSGFASVLEATHNLEPKGEHYKMALLDEVPLATVDCSEVAHLSSQDIAPIQVLYKESYPGNWFDPRMLETNKYFGIRENGRLVSIAGVHVYSSKYKVAALGNIATLPAYRGRGCATRVTARLCRSLIEEGVAIGLNVKADNTAAISCYQQLGFQIIASYEEYLATAL
jgi:ribosomal protein S18 acetylase RimI-like enzyme